LFRALIQASPPAIAALDHDGNVSMWNPAAKRIFGWREAEVLFHSGAESQKHKGTCEPVYRLTSDVGRDMVSSAPSWPGS
jgi:PAS domain S-box-containing protein